MPWTTLQPSVRARQWRRVGLGLGVASAVALLAAAAASRPFNASLALFAGIAGFGVWAATRARASGRFEIGVSSLGQIELRERDRPDADASAPLRVAFASPWLISLRRGAMLIAIWPDSLPQSIYRQLWVHLRWGRAMPSDDDRRATSTNRANSMDR